MLRGIITGSGSGIGLAAVKILLSTQPTAHIVAIDLNGQALEPLSLQYPGRLKVVLGDVSERETSERSVASAITNFGHLDSLVLNAAVLSPVGPIATAKIEEWKRLYDVNFFSMLHWIQTALPQLRESHGSIIMTSSGVSVRPYPAWIAYASSKRAVNCLCAGLVLEEPLITAICVTPGAVDTGLQKEVREKHKENFPEHMYKWLDDLHKAGGLLKPEQPGGSLGKLAMNGIPTELSGQLIPWDDIRISGDDKS